MKTLKEGEEMPIDFWNYVVNPITGYYVEPRYDNPTKNEKKYFKMPQSI